MSFWSENFWSSNFWTENFWSTSEGGGGGDSGSGSLLLCSSIGGSAIVDEENAVGSVVDFHGGDKYRRAQSFTTPAEAGIITGVCFKLGAVTGSPTGNLKCSIYNITGTPGSNAKPSGSAVVTSTTINDISLVSSSGLWIGFEFSWAYTPSTTYCAAIEIDTDSGVTDTSNRIGIRHALTGGPAGQNGSYYNGSWVALSAQDTDLRVYKTNAAGIITTHVITDIYTLN